MPRDAAASQQAAQRPRQRALSAPASLTAVLVRTQQQYTAASTSARPTQCGKAQPNERFQISCRVSSRALAALYARQHNTAAGHAGTPPSGRAEPTNEGQKALSHMRQGLPAVGRRRTSVNRPDFARLRWRPRRECYLVTPDDGPRAAVDFHTIATGRGSLTCGLLQYRSCTHAPEELLCSGCGLCRLKSRSRCAQSAYACMHEALLALAAHACMLATTMKTASTFAGAPGRCHGFWFTEVGSGVRSASGRSRRSAALRRVAYSLESSDIRSTANLRAGVRKCCKHDSRAATVIQATDTVNAVRASASLLASVGLPRI